MTHCRSDFDATTNRYDKEIPMHDEFAVHMLNESGKIKAAYIALAFDECLDKLLRLIPTCRETSIVKTKLEEACFFAKKAMAKVPENTDEAP